MRTALALVVLCGCNVIFGFDDLHPLPDAPDPGSAPHVYSFPGPRRGGNYWGSSFSVVLAADDPSATIFYTTDGSDVSTSSMSGATPIKGISVTANRNINYLAQGPSGATSLPAGDTYVFDTTARSLLGYTAHTTLLDGASPLVTVAPGTKITGATAKVQMWVQSACPACATQLVYGLVAGATASYQGCLYDGSPGVYPGITKTATFTVTAPAMPGVYELRVVSIEDTSCTMALADGSLKGRPDVLRIGLVVVR